MHSILYFHTYLCLAFRNLANVYLISLPRSCVFELRLVLFTVEEHYIFHNLLNVDNTELLVVTVSQYVSGQS